MNKLVVVAMTVALLALSAESFRVPRQAEEEEELGTLAKFTNAVKSYYDSSVDTATGYLDNIRGMKLEEKAKNLYHETTLATATYFSIMQDQLYYLFYPQQ